MKQFFKGTTWPGVAMAAFVSLVAVIILLAGEAWAAQNQKTARYVTIATGGVTGVYYPAGGAICRLVNKGRPMHSIRCSVESTGGSIANIKAIRDHDSDFGVVQSDVQFASYHGTSPFASQPPYKELRSLFTLHPDLFTVVARADAGIRSFQDLKGKRVNVGNVGSGQRSTMETVMAAKGWVMDDFSKIMELTSAEQSKALCDDKIDAMVFAAGHPNASIKEATMTCDTILVDVTGPAIDKLVARFPYYRAANVPGGMYRGTDNDVQTFGVGATVVTSMRTADDVVYTVVKSVFENFENFKLLHPAFARLNKKDMIQQGLTAPLHPGAERYYKEVGLLK